jgi:hypothetical protein
MAPYSARPPGPHGKDPPRKLVSAVPFETNSVYSSTTVCRAAAGMVTATAWFPTAIW